MEDLLRQLKALRRHGRGLLLGHALGPWFAAVCGGALLLAALDHALHLPGWFRLLIGGGAAGAAVIWLGRGVAAALRFGRDLPGLALRVERSDPAWRGQLAAAVELAAAPESSDARGRTRRLAAASVDRALRAFRARRLRPGELFRLRPVWLRMGWGVAGLAALLAVALLAPAKASIATRRWAMPLGPAAWPKRTDIRAGDTPSVWAADTPLRLRARVLRGFREGMRVWLVHRRTSADGVAGPWRRRLMNRQTGAAGSAVFERILDPRKLAPPAEAGATLRYRFEAGDDRTPVAETRLVERPALAAASLRIEPPAYARGLVEPRERDLTGRRKAAVSALAGSTWRWRLRFNKPIPADDLTLGSLAPPLAQRADARATSGSDRRSAVLRWRLRESVSVPLSLRDAHGLEAATAYRFRFKVEADAAPRARLPEPASDRAVLARAKVPVAAAGRDDVGLEHLAVLAARPEAEGAAIAERAGRARRMRLETSLDLAERELAPGDVLRVWARARDVFRDDGRRHEPARSAVRRIRVIEADTLEERIRDELTAVRDEAIRIAERQRDVGEGKGGVHRQRRVAERIRAQRKRLADLEARRKRNRLERADLARTLRKAEKTGARAADAAEEAARAAERGDDAAARAQRRAAARRLDELISMLERGEGPAAMRRRLGALRERQEALRAAMERLMAETVGRSREALAERTRQRLDEMSERQGRLAKRARELVEAMRDAASSTSEDPRGEAAAEAMRAAADRAERAALQEKMSQAGEAASDNRLSSATRRQKSAVSVMKKMERTLGEARQRRRDVLRRRMSRLAERIAGLIEKQKAQLAALRGAGAAGPLVPPLERLRGNTLAVAEDARAARRTRPIAEPLSDAAADQRSALAALESEETDRAREDETAALADLEKAKKRLAEEKRALARREAGRERAELRREYRDLAKRQRGLREATVPIAERENPGRAARAEAIALGHKQSDIGIAARELRSKVEKRVVFGGLHDTIAAASDAAADALRGGAPSAATLARQRLIADALEQMARALAPESERADFRGPAGGRGGGGASGGGSTRVVPPAAELRLLKGMQETLARRTRRAARDGQPVAGLARRQRALAELGRSLLRRLEKQAARKGEAP